MIRCEVVNAISRGEDNSDLLRAPPWKSADLLKRCFSRGFRLAKLRAPRRGPPPSQQGRRRWQAKLKGPILERGERTDEELLAECNKVPPVLAQKRSFMRALRSTLDGPTAKRCKTYHDPIAFLQHQWHAQPFGETLTTAQRLGLRADEKIYRFCPTQALMRHEVQTLEEAPPPAQIQNLSVASWNAGPLRGLGMEAFRCGAFHVVMSQEFAMGPDVDPAPPAPPPQEKPRKWAKWHWPHPGDWPFWTSSGAPDPADAELETEPVPLQHTLLQQCGFKVIKHIVVQEIERVFVVVSASTLYHHLPLELCRSRLTSCV